MVVTQLRPDFVNLASSPDASIEVVLEHDGGKWYYYLVDHSKRCVFWDFEFDMTWMAKRVGGVGDKSQLRGQTLTFHIIVPTNLQRECRIQQEYWKHVHHFPYFVELQDDVFQELKGILLYERVGSCQFFPNRPTCRTLIPHIHKREPYPLHARRSLIQIKLMDYWPPSSI